MELVESSLVLAFQCKGKSDQSGGRRLQTERKAGGRADKLERAERRTTMKSDAPSRQAALQNDTPSLVVAPLTKMMLPAMRILYGRKTSHLTSQADPSASKQSRALISFRMSQICHSLAQSLQIARTQPRICCSNMWSARARRRTEDKLLGSVKGVTS